MQEVVRLIKNKTGLDINVYCGGGLAAGTFLSPEHFPLPAPADFTDGLFQDKRSGRTFFESTFGKENIIGVISSAGAGAKKIAALAAALIEQAGRQQGNGGSKESKIRRFILGESTLSSVGDLFQFRDGGYYVYYIDAGANYSSVIDLASAMAENGDIAVGVGGDVIAYLKALGRFDVFADSKDFAEMLSDSIEQELLIRTGIGAGGAAMKAEEIPPAFLRAAAACRLGKIAAPKECVYEYKDYILHKILDDLPQEAIKEYYSQLADKGAQEILDDRELTATAESFLSNSLNISETARLMYMHRNTLIYRLDKIEKATGLNIRIFSDAVTFKLLLFMHKIQSAPKKGGLA